MAQNTSNDCCKAPQVNSKIDEAACSCSHCDIKNASEKPQDLTCSCEDCTEACLYYTCADVQSNRPANPPKKIKPPTSSPTTPSGDNAVMSTTLRQQESTGKLQKRAYLPASETKLEKECVVEKCTCMGDRVYGNMTATLQQQESIVGLQKRAYLAADSEKNPKKECLLEKCTCITSDPCGNIQNKVRKESPNLCGAGFCSEVSKIGHKQELPDYLHGDVGHVFDVPKMYCDKQESFQVPKICCDEQESSEIPKIGHKQELPDYLNGDVGYVFDVPKIGCNKQKSSDYLNNAAGYVFDVPKISYHKQKSSEIPKFCHKKESSEVPKIYYHKQESSKAPKFWHKQESSEVPKHCRKQESSRVPKICCHKQESSEVPKICHQQEAPDLEKDGAGYIFDVPKSYSDKQELPDYLNGAAGYVYDVPKIGCNKQKSPDYLNNAAGYIFDVPKSCSDKQKSPNLMTTCYVFNVPKICYYRQESPDFMKGAAGYVFDVLKIGCNKQKSPDYLNNAAGYIFDVPKISHQQEAPDLEKDGARYIFDVPKSCSDKQELPDYLNGAAGYVFDVPKRCSDKQELPDYLDGAAGYVFDVPKSCSDKKESPNFMTTCYVFNVPKICYYRQGSPDFMKGAAGYVFDVPKIGCNKQKSPDYLNNAAGYVFDVPKIWHDKQESPNHMKDAAGYVFDVPKTYKELSKKGQEIGIERQCCKENKKDKKKKTNEFNMCNELESTSSETKTSQVGSKNNTQVLNINKLVSKRTTSDTMHICCTTKKESDSHQYKPMKNAQGLFKNILQTQENAFKIEDTLSGYIYELPKYSPTTQKKSCECRESLKNKSVSQNISGLSGYVIQMTCRSLRHEPANNTRKIDKSMESASDTKNTLLKKKSCEASGYVWEVPKHSTKHSDHKKQKCDCNESAKYKSDKPEYGFEQKNKINNCAYTEPAKRKPKLPECANDGPICREIDNAERVWKNKKSSESKCKKKIECEPPGYIYELPKYTHKLLSQKISSVCRESVKNKSGSPAYAQELTKCTHKPQSQKSSSEFVSKADKIPSELPGYVFVVPKQTQKSCSCTKSVKSYSKSSHESANNAEEVSINRLKSKYIQPDTQSICKSMVGTQTNTTKVLERSMGLPHPASKYTIDLWKDVIKNQAEAIEVLKNIYLPQKGKIVSTTCCCPLSLTEPSDTIKKCKNAAIQPGTANLSAEELSHMSDAEFNDCLLCRQLNISNKPRKISKTDIIKRLKEAYKACSCKICECFASSKPVKTDASKPECDKCLRSISSHETNKQPLCSCKPCDCAQCIKSLVEQCHCDPCQCGDCKRRNINQGQRFMVAPVVTEIYDILRVACICSPCACIECGLVYPYASSIVNQMSTSTNKHALCRCEFCLNESSDQSGFDSCKCQKHNKVMSKPVEHDTHEFDIRTARIVHNTPMFQRLGRNNTIAMFAAIPVRYPTFDDRLSHTQTCSCKECECIFCVCQQNAIKSSQLCSSNKAKSKSYFNDRYNNCELKMPYECQLYQEIQSHDKSCVYDNCDCLNCETSNMPKNLYRFGRHRYSDGSYEHYSKKETPGRVLHPFKKGDVLTPSTHKLKVQNLILQKKHLDESSGPKVMTNTDSTSKLRDIDIFNELTSKFNASKRKIDSIKQAKLYMNDFNTRYIHRCKTLECDAYMHYQERNKRSLHKNITIDNDNEISGSCFSDHSSSYYKHYSSNTVISRNKSRESSCNSSGNNYPEYFIQVPKGTDEISLKDVIKLDIDETINLDKCNTIQNSTEKHNVDKISYGNKNSCKINECNHFSNNKLIARPTESNNNNWGNAHIASMRRNYKNSLHVQLNNQNDKHKNCMNNDLQNGERNELQNSAWLTGSQSSLKMNNANREYMNAIHDFNEFQVARNVYYNNISEGNTSKQTTHSDFANGAEILNVLDYKRVRNTLMNAKKFSLELITLLKTYEKANEEFKSNSEKLKLSHPI